MLERLKIKARQAGTSPGTLVHIGEKKTEQTTITILAYNQRHMQQQVVNAVEDCRSTYFPSQYF